MKPIIVYVSGAPGSGKTTLAKLLSEQLYIPHVPSDLIQGGIELTHPGHDRQTAIGAAFVPLMADMAGRNISFVVDHVLQKDIAKVTIIDKLVPHADIIYVHVQTSDPIGRYIRRIEASDLPNIIRRRNLLLERANYHRENLINTMNPIELDVPTLVVNTDDGYSPGVETIMKFIQKHESQA